MPNEAQKLANVGAVIRAIEGELGEVTRGGAEQAASRSGRVMAPDTLKACFIGSKAHSCEMDGDNEAQALTKWQRSWNVDSPSGALAIASRKA